MRISDWSSDVCSSDLRAAELHAVVRARVDEGVVDDEVAALRQRREERGIGGEAGGEEERGLAAVMARGMGFERLMFGVIAAQQARSARARGKAALDARGERVAQRVAIDRKSTRLNSSP